MTENETKYIEALKQLQMIEDDLGDALIEAQEAMKGIDEPEKVLCVVGIKKCMQQVHQVRSFLLERLQQHISGRERDEVIDAVDRITKCRDCAHVSTTAVLWCRKHDNVVKGDYFCADGEART